MAGQGRGAALRTGALKVLTAVGIAGGAIVIGNSAVLVTAAETPPQIRQAERNDPAAGEVVIINRKRKPGTTADKTAAPDKKQAKRSPRKPEPAPNPYAPRPTEDAGTAPRKVERKARPAPSPPRAASVREPTQTAPLRATEPVAPEAPKTQAAAPLPPPPAVNSESRPARAAEKDDVRRQRSTRRSDRWSPARRFDEADDRETFVRRGVARDRARALHPPPGYRPRGRDRRYAEREPGPRWRNIERRDYRSVPSRPWRACRRLAWRCRDGFERACWRWQRQCR